MKFKWVRFGFASVLSFVCKAAVPTELLARTFLSRGGKLTKLGPQDFLWDPHTHLSENCIKFSIPSRGNHYGLFILEHMDSPHTTATRQGSTRHRLPKTNNGADSKLTARRHVYSRNRELNQRQLRARVSTLCEPTQDPGHYWHNSQEQVTD